MDSLIRNTTVVLKIGHEKKIGKVKTDTFKHVMSMPKLTCQKASTQRGVGAWVTTMFFIVGKYSV